MLDKIDDEIKNKDNKKDDGPLGDKKDYQKLEDIISTNSIDYIKDLINQIKIISSYFHMIDPTSQNIYSELNPQYKSLLQKVKNKYLLPEVFNPPKVIPSL